eukprot:179363_1
MPFRSALRDPLLETLNCKIETSRSLEQRLRCFLYSYYEVEQVQTLWGDHPAMPNIVEMEDQENANENKYDDDYKSSFSNISIQQFDETYLERDVIYFFKNLLLSAPEKGEEFVIDPNIEIYDLMG